MNGKSLLGIGCGLWMLASECAAQLLNIDLGVTIAWDANVEPEVVGYNVYAGRTSQAYDYVVDAGPETTVRVAPLEAGVSFFFAVTAYNAEGLESPFSEEISYALPINGTNAFLIPLRLVLGTGGESSIEFDAVPGRTYLVQASSDLQSWERLEIFPPVTVGTVIWRDGSSALPPYRFYRVVSQIVPDELPSVLDGTGIVP